MVTETIPNNKEDNDNFTLYNEYKHILKGIAKPIRCMLMFHMLKEKRKIDDANDVTITPIIKIMNEQKTRSNKMRLFFEKMILNFPRVSSFNTFIMTICVIMGF